MTAQLHKKNWTRLWKRTARNAAGRPAQERLRYKPVEQRIRTDLQRKGMCSSPGLHCFARGASIEIQKRLTDELRDQRDNRIAEGFQPGPLLSRSVATAGDEGLNAGPQASEWTETSCQDAPLLIFFR